MYGQNNEETRKKSDRALALYEQGLKSSQISERLGVTPHNVGSMIRNARSRRERLKLVEDKH